MEDFIRPNLLRIMISHRIGIGRPAHRGWASQCSGGTSAGPRDGAKKPQPQLQVRCLRWNGQKFPENSQFYDVLCLLWHVCLWKRTVQIRNSMTFLPALDAGSFIVDLKLRAFGVEMDDNDCPDWCPTAIPKHLANDRRLSRKYAGMVQPPFV